MSQDEFIDFDVISPYHGGSSDNSFASGVTLEQLQEGTIINTPVKEDGDDNDDDIWWTKDELLKHLEDGSSPMFVDSVPWDEKVNSMEPLIENQVYKKIIKPGIGSGLRRKNAILFHCNGYIEGSDEPFDSSILRGRPILHRLDRQDLLPGLMIGILSMRLHEKAEILIKPDYGFGELGCPPRIPANATIIYIVEIMKIFEEGSLADYELMTNEELARIPFSEIIQKCNEQRMSGNSYFSAERYRDAALRYTKAIKFLEKYFFKNAEEQNCAKEILSKLYPNIANSLIRLRKLRPAMVYCRKALEINPNNVKALCQLGKAKFNNGDYDQAKIFFSRACDLKPGDSYISNYMIKVDRKLQEESMVTQDLYRKIGQAFLANN
ncbi:inactive peptidyl-prolyl cis-trans isomerase FKBP6-like [Panonychus citri]|uniref:inactive peptidyl-prolyl cis-trans isomerase FKBP6-like n=1 Tax=Panonychus citri TaxID=50023 RepID=UPI002307733E|nr:inactive peptidyl-prolyl cis-trans isomerase FKBP6-like [Panonychus citri]